MGVGYQFTDRNSFDYELWPMCGFGGMLRGPRTLYDESSEYWTFVGAAQTFGRFAERPFPAIVSSWFNKPHLNLGFAGAGPELFLRRPAFLDRINRSEMCFLQIMSGRSISTKLLKAIGQGGVLEFTEGPLEGQRFLAADAYRKLLAHYGREAVQHQIGEARRNWTEMTAKLIERIKVPVVCVWISHRDYNYEVAFDNPATILGDFPHLVTQEQLNPIRERKIDIVGNRLSSVREQLLLDFATRKPKIVYSTAKFVSRDDWSRGFNTYYPTPEVHQAIAKDLIVWLMGNRHLFASGPSCG